MIYLINLLERINIKSCFVIGYTGIFSYIFYNTNNYCKIFLIILLLGKLKLIYNLCNSTILEFICFKTNLNLDLDIVYLLYKNRDDKKKLKLLLKDLDDDTKKILYSSIYKLI